MAVSESTNLGSRLGEELDIFRAFAEKSWRKRKANPPHQATHYAFLLREQDIANGLSVGLTARACVSGLDTNEGYCSLSVGRVHNLSHNLEVRLDTKDPHHAFICNLPYVGVSDEDRKRAVFIARDLVLIADVKTCDPYIPNGCHVTSVD